MNSTATGNNGGVKNPAVGRSCREKLQARWLAYWAVPDPLLLRTALFLLVLALLLALAGAAGFWAYGEARGRMFLYRAGQAMARQEWGTAQLQLQLALRKHPDDVKATRLMVQIGDEVRAPWEGEWRMRLYELAPEDEDNTLQLAEIALKNGRSTLARNLAGKLAGSRQKQPAAENVLALLAAKEGKNQEAAGHFEKALELDPDYGIVLANYAAFLIAESPAQHGPKIEVLLQKLEDKPGAGLAAKRLRLAWLRGQGRDEEAWQLSCGLVAEENASFADHLQQMALASADKRPEFAALLEQAMAEGKKKAHHAVQLLELLVGNGQSGLAFRFLESLPEEMRSQTVLKKIEAELLRKAPDWEALKRLTEKNDWGVEEGLRLAYRAEALEKTGDGKAAQSAREEAVRMASKSPIQVFRLLDGVAAWPGWERESEEMLWTLSKTPGFAGDALTALFALYHHQKNAAGLERVTERLAKLYPDNALHQHNHVGLMLLNGTQLPQAWRRAEELAAKHPQDDLALSNRAFALCQQKKAGEGLAVFQKIPAQIRERPPFQFYYGLCLIQAGNEEEGRRVWKGLETASLLDAEQLLLKNAAKH